MTKLYLGRWTEDLHLPTHDIITTWDEGFNEGVWFAVFTADFGSENVDTVVFLDAFEVGVEDKLKQLIKDDNWVDGST